VSPGFEHPSDLTQALLFSLPNFYEKAIVARAFTRDGPEIRRYRPACLLPGSFQVRTSGIAG
jgi:hypothetical protein